MENHQHSMTNLFEQLGLPSSAADIQTFIETHRPLDAQIKLCEAPFWSAAQSQFLREQIKSDADWAVIIDNFDSRLRKELVSS